MKKVMIVFVLMAIAFGGAAPSFNPLSAVVQVARDLVQGAANAVSDTANGIVQTPRFLISKAVTDAIVMGSMAVLPSPVHSFFAFLIQLLVAFVNALYIVI